MGHEVMTIEVYGGWRKKVGECIKFFVPLGDFSEKWIY